MDSINQWKIMQGIILSDMRFSQLGGLQLEREIRRLTGHLSSAYPHAPVSIFSHILLCAV